MFNFRLNIPGIPGVDYPLHSNTNQSNFTCDGRVGGAYYADPALGCQVLHHPTLQLNYVPPLGVPCLPALLQGQKNTQAVFPLSEWDDIQPG